MNLMFNRCLLSILKLGKTVKGSPLTFEEDDITLQNLQARVRCPSIWMIANMQGKLLLTTVIVLK